MRVDKLKMNKLTESSVPFKIIVLIGICKERQVMTSYDTNAQVHQTFDLCETYGGKCVYVGFFYIFLIVFGT